MISNSSIYSTITTTTKIDVYVKTHGTKTLFQQPQKINPSCLETTLDNKEPLHQSPPKCNKRTSDHRNFFNNNLPIIIHSPFTTKNGSKCAAMAKIWKITKPQSCLRPFPTSPSEYLTGDCPQHFWGKNSSLIRKSVQPSWLIIAD